MTEVRQSLLIDRNRGTTEKNTPAGLTVIQFNDEPGAYYDRKGKPVSARDAREAGFDVLLDSIEKRTREKIAEATDEAHAEATELRRHAAEEAEAEVLAEVLVDDAADPARERFREPAPTLTPEAETTEPTEPTGPTKVRAGRAWNVIGADGTVISEALNKADADDLLRDLQGG